MIQSSTRHTATSTLLVLCTALTLLTTLPAHATLGGDSASVSNDQAVLGATMRITTMDGYTDYALNLPRGGTVHEFVNSANQVFEITWSKYGSRPNMVQIMGDYVNRFSGTTNGSGPTSRHADRVEADFELHSKAVNRYFSGTAHLPGSLPANRREPVPLPLEIAK